MNESDGTLTENYALIGQSSCTVDQVTVKLENLQHENQILRATVKKINDRLGDEMIHESSLDETIDSFVESKDPNVNTLYFKRDGFLGQQYYYKTDVSGLLVFLQNKDHSKVIYIHDSTNNTT